MAVECEQIRGVGQAGAAGSELAEGDFGINAGTVLCPFALGNSHSPLGLGLRS